MKNTLAMILIVSLLFLEGCSIIGYTIGKGTYEEEQIAGNALENVEEDSWLTITFKDNEVIEGKFRSCENDTLLVAFQTTEFQESNNNYVVYPIADGTIMYKVPFSKIHELKMRTGNRGSTGFIAGLLVDVIIITLIIFEIRSNIKPDLSSWN